jgi:exosome complex RNA-binding protein Rrp4
LPIGVSVILGNNGYVWISPLANGRMPGTNLEQEDPDGQKPVLEEVRSPGKAGYFILKMNCSE